MQQTKTHILKISCFFHIQDYSAFTYCLPVISFKLSLYFIIKQLSCTGQITYQVKAADFVGNINILLPYNGETIKLSVTEYVSLYYLSSTLCHVVQ